MQGQTGRVKSVFEASQTAGRAAAARKGSTDVKKLSLEEEQAEDERRTAEAAADVAKAQVWVPRELALGHVKHVRGPCPGSDR